MTLATAVKEARESREMSIDELSGRIFSTKKFLVGIENGEILSPMLDTIRKISKAVGMTMSEFLYNVE